MHQLLLVAHTANPLLALFFLLLLRLLIVHVGHPRSRRAILT